MYMCIFILGIYMHTKKVNECAVTSERSVFESRIVMSYPRCVETLVFVFCGSGVLSGIRG